MIVALFVVSLVGFLIALPGASLVARYWPFTEEAAYLVWALGMTMMLAGAAGGWFLLFTGGA